MDRPIRFTAYARRKVVFLRERGVEVDEAAVRRTVREPERVIRGHSSRWVAQRGLSEQHLLRVVYEELPHERVIVTCYPARRSRYESAHDI